MVVNSDSSDILPTNLTDGAVSPIDIDQRLHQVAKRCPDKVALTDSNRRFTWDTLDKTLNQVAHALIEIGMAPNQRIAILASNSVDYALLFLGGLRAGVCITPLSTLASSDALAGMINDSEAKLLFVSKDYWNLVDSVTDKLTGLSPDGIKILGAEGMEIDSYDPQSFRAFIEGASTDVVAIPVSLDWGFNLIYSSGTTGVPKGILQSRRYRSLEAQALMGLGFDSNSRALISTPLYSNTSLFLFMAILANGGTVFLMEKFSTARFLEISQREKITHTVLVPVQYQRLLKDSNLDSTDLSSYQFKCSTSAPLHKPVKQSLLKRWPEGGLWEFYGMTEGGVNCALAAHERPDKLDTVGQPSEGCDVRIIDEQGNELPQGQTGEVVGWCDRMMEGYHNRPEATREASWFDKQGRRFQKSGDIGWLDEENFLHLLDRKKDMIISGGFNVYAIDLEKVLLSHPDVTDAAVIAAPSEQWGETPVAFVVLEPGVRVEVDRLREWANKQLGKAQRISRIEFIDELPRSPIGKVLKRELKSACGAAH